MTANLKTQIDLEKMAGETQIEQQGGITPTFVFHNGVSLKTETYSIAFENSEQKEHLHQLMKEILEDTDAKWYVCLMEFWITEFTEAAEKYKRVADMPLDDRVEVVAVCSSIRGEEPVAQVAQIERTGDKAKLLHWHEVKMTENNGFGLYKW